MIHSAPLWADRKLGRRGRSELTDTRAAWAGLAPNCTIVEKSPALEAELCVIQLTTEPREKRRPNEVIAAV